jgi:hypothetical protein
MRRGAEYQLFIQCNVYNVNIIIGQNVFPVIGRISSDSAGSA